jgi:hypothetical protein
MKQSITVAQIADFFERFDRPKQVAAEQFVARFNAFKLRYEEKREQAEIETRQSAPGFNIFRFLGEVWRSEKFHSDFIAYLLDPRESHGQGHLFLQTFFSSFKRKYPEVYVPNIFSAHGSWLVQREFITRYGNLDIVLRNPLVKGLYVIENKVDAEEQVDQIARYSEYLEGQAKEYPYQSLLFLTPDGHSSVTANGKPYHPISYHSDITAWLERALPEVGAVIVRETVRQYQNLIRDL